MQQKKQIGSSLPHKKIHPTKIHAESTQQEFSEFFKDLKNTLDNKFYGMHDVKEELMTIFMNKIFNPNTKFNAIALLGPPGVGKTDLIRTFADALGYPFQQISLGGAQDTSYLEGHGFCYEGSRPGIIVKSLIKTQASNCILFFDEIDKLSLDSRGKDVSNCLLHITDFTQNSDFRDKYLDDIPVDLSKVFFVFSMNDLKVMDPTLRDRIPVISVSGYKKSEKCTILKTKLMTRHLSEYKINPDDCIMSNSVCNYLIDKLAENSTDKHNELTGVRDIEKWVVKFVRYLNLHLKMYDGTKLLLSLQKSFTNFKIPFVVENEHVDIILNSLKDDMSSSYMYT